MTTSTARKPVVPVRFKPDETEFLAEAALKTGLYQAELIRRAIRLLRTEARKQNGFGFLLEIPADA